MDHQVLRVINNELAVFPYFDRTFIKHIDPESLSFHHNGMAIRTGESFEHGLRTFCILGDFHHVRFRTRTSKVFSGGGPTFSFSAGPIDALGAELAEAAGAA